MRQLATLVEWPYLVNQVEMDPFEPNDQSCRALSFPYTIEGLGLVVSFTPCTKECGDFL